MGCSRMGEKSNRIYYLIAGLVVVSIIASGSLIYLTSGNGENESGNPDKIGLGFTSSDLEREEDPDFSQGELSDLVEGNSKFALDLYRRIKDKEGNLFYSPYSVSTALSMTYAGARGDTARQMKDTLNFGSCDQLHSAFNSLNQQLNQERENFVLNIANALWGQENYHFEENFLDVLARNYGAGMYRLDFKGSPDPSRRTINDWVENRTENKIEKLLPPGSINPATRLVLTNAIYFNASWEDPFQEEDTQKENFTLPDGDQVEVPMMSQTNHFQFLDGDGYSAVELPYQDEKASMLIILPSRGRLKELERNLNTAFVENIVKNFESKSVRLKMPKFDFKFSTPLSKTLSEMGMPSAFDQEGADFSGMTGDRSLWIDEVYHKAFVSVDEKGTEAAAATAVVMPTSAPVEPVTMDIDRPFIFLIRDEETGTILFTGRVTNPAA